MKRTRVRSAIGIMSVAALFSWVTAAGAQTFSSGSNGTLGAFAPGANTTVVLPSDGILNYTTVTIPAGVTVSFTPNAANTPVTMLATGDVVVAGTINLSGVSGLSPNSTVGSPASNEGGRGGPGGFAGGGGGTRGQANLLGAAGLGSGGGPPVSLHNGGTYGAPSTFVSLLPLFGGSGGGGANADAVYSGGSGSGGGGAIVIASTTKITVTGSIIANGGNAAPGGSPFCGSLGYLGVGSGGAIRLVAPELVSTGVIQARIGSDGQCGGSTPGGPAGGAGRIRFEGLVFGTIAATDPVASVVTTLGPIISTSVPALLNLPTLAFTSVGGIAPPTTPTGSYTTADVTLPPTTTNPVSVILTATNTPVPTPYTIRLIPRFGGATTQTVSSSGSFAISTATANVTFPNGRISALQAYAGFTLTASLAPMIDGEPADQVLLAAGYGEPSTLTLVTKSGREIPVSELSQADQLKVAQAFEAMKSEAR
jgi:hypothetical protein